MTKITLKFLFITLTIALLLVLSQCGTTTKLTGSWEQNPDETYHFKKIAIIGIAKVADVRKMVEDNIETLLREQGINAVGGLTFLPPEATKENISPELVKAFLTSEGADAVITISMLRRQDRKEVTGGGYYYVPYSNAYFGDYYGQMSNYYYSPGYEYTSTDVFLETNLYSFPEGKLLYSAQTETVDFSSAEIAASQLSKEIVKDLTDKKVVMP